MYESSADGVDENILVLFHGHGDCASNFAAFARKLKLPQTALLVFNGPLPFPSADMPNGRTWYGDDEQAESALLQQCVTELTAVVDALVAHGWRHKQLHLCGFSDGGQVALELALRYCGPKVLGSCVAMSAALTVSRDEDITPCAGPHTPVLISRGTLDDVITEEDVAQTVAILRHARPTCGLHVLVLPGKEHAMPRSYTEMRGIMEFWSHVLRSRPPDDAVELTQ